MRIVSVAAFALILGCMGTRTQRVDVDSEDPGVETGSKDFRAVTDSMVRSMLETPELSAATPPPLVAVIRVENRTQELLDTRMFTARMRSLLVKGAGRRIRFVDRSADSLGAIEAERDAKRAGALAGTSAKEMLGVDYFLTGEIASIDKTRGDARSNYTRYSFRITDAESSEIIWEDEYEVKKTEHQGIWDR